MSFRPDAEGLLAIARATFVESVLPSLPAEKRHAGLMIANALGIALRELGAGDESSAHDVAELTELLDESSPGPSSASLASLESELAVRIRAGAFDEGASSEA